MRIAVFHNLPSGGAKRGVYEEVKYLARHGHHIDLFSLSTADQDFADIRPFVRSSLILPFKPARMLRSPFGRLNQALRLIDLLRLERAMRTLETAIDRGGYNVALVHPCMFSFSPAILRYLQIPSVYYRHDPVRWVQDPEIPRPYHKLNTWRRRLDRVDPLRNAYYGLLVHSDLRSMRAATRVVTNSYFMRETIYRVSGVAPSVCYPGVDTDLFLPLHVPRQNFVISVGAILPNKGYDFIIKSLGLVPASSRPQLMVVANAALMEEQAYLSQLAHQFEVRVTFHRRLSDRELVQLYNQAQCTVYAPIMEPFGLAPLESMACGTPVIGVREGGVRETIRDGETGLLTDRDPADFAQALLALLSNPRMLEEMGRKGRDWVMQTWRWEKGIERLEQHIYQVAE